jgi:hypothetical protein
MINWERTKQDFGYGEEEAKKFPRSSKHAIWATCDNPDCDSSDHRERLFEWGTLLKKIKRCKDQGKDFLCQKCAHSHRKGITSKKRNTEVPALPSQVSDELTLERFGYRASDLKPWSRNYIVLVCDCGKESEIKRTQINSYKSIKETGNFKCTGCWTRDRRKGIKLSSETKDRMKESQKRRRDLEKEKKSDTLRNL